MGTDDASPDGMIGSTVAGKAVLAIWNYLGGLQAARFWVLSEYPDRKSR